MINGTTARPSSGVWNHPREHIRANDMSLRLIEFFDWGTLDYRDWKLLRVEIAASTAYPDVVGREGLLEVSSVKVLAFADTQLPGSLAAAIVDLHAAIP